MPSRRIKSTKFGSVKIMDSLSAFDDLYTAIEACLIYPDEVIDRLARTFYPAILACWNSEEGQREFAAWQAEQAHHTTRKEKQSVPDCWVSVKQFSKNDTATACQDWLRSTRLGRGSIKSHVRTVKVLGMGLFAFQERVHLLKGVTH